MLGVITIDGPAGSGKSTVARLIAKRFGATFLDTGAIYRSLALSAQREGIAWEDAAGLADLAQRLDIRFRTTEGGQDVWVAGENITEAIRTPHIARGASTVSQWPGVRSALLGVQRALAQHGPLVAEGRDTGTVVFADAPLKVFLVADDLVRARRRHAEQVASGQQVALDQVLSEQRRRDQSDRERAVAPLRKADDAVEIDTSHLEIEEVVDRVADLARRAAEASKR